MVWRTLVLCKFALPVSLIPVDDLVALQAVQPCYSSEYAVSGANLDTYTNRIHEGPGVASTINQHESVCGAE